MRVKRSRWSSETREQRPENLILIPENVVQRLQCNEIMASTSKHLGRQTFIVIVSINS